MPSLLLSLVLLATLLAGQFAVASSDPWWGSRIEAHSNGVVSRHAAIVVRLVAPLAGETSPSAGLFTLDPAVEGRVRYSSDRRELHFLPAATLSPSTSYRIELDPDHLPGFDDAPGPFSFSLETMEQAFELQIDGPRLDPADPQRMEVSGTLLTADREPAAAISQLIEVEWLERPLQPVWQHDESGRRHQFHIQNLQRGTAARELALRWNGEPIDAGQQGARLLTIEPLDRFVITGITSGDGNSSSTNGDKRIVVEFSSPLAPYQSLDGLATLNGVPLKGRIDGGQLTLYPPSSTRGEQRLIVHNGIRSIHGATLPSTIERTLSFDPPLPQVRFVGQGSIIAGGTPLAIPFEARNVHSVDVTAFRIHSTKMGQFLQSNGLDGNDELGRVGRYLWRRTLALQAPQPNQWQRYALDATSLLDGESGDLFRLTLSIHRGHSTLPCKSGAALPAQPPLKDQESLHEEVESSGWDGVIGWNSAAPEPPNDYSDWGDRHDPCSDAYFRYSGNSSSSRNLLTSTIGLIAKQGREGELLVAASDLASAQPLSEVTIEVRNFQDQTIAVAKSDEQGFARIDPQGTPFYLIATSNDQRAYLRLNPGSALPVSHFDTAGEIAPGGIRGFLYGERGVWRPGDQIHLNLLLHDPEQRLPAGHPATLELLDPRGRVRSTYHNGQPIGPFYRFTATTPEDGPTGRWLARARLGGLTFEKPLAIAAIRPNRLEIELDLPDQLTTGDPLNATISSHWLHGAPASNLAATIDASFQATETRFDRFNDFRFDDPARELAGGLQRLFEGELDESGSATFKTTIELPTPPPGMVKASLTARVAERGGDHSSSMTEATLHPFNRYVGVRLPPGDTARGMLLTDTDHPVAIAVVDRSGQPVAADQISLTLYKLDWRWWWESSDEDLSAFASNHVRRPLQQGTAATRADGTAEWSFSIRYPDWGRYLIRACLPAGGHCSGQIVYVDWPGWAGRAREQRGIGATMLELRSDRERYTVGDTLYLTLPEGRRGRALLTIEGARGISRNEWHEISPERKPIAIKLDRSLAPLTYMAVTLLQPLAGRDNDQPLRLYGVLPVTIDDPSTRLAPQIEVADQWRPEQAETITISEEHGRAMSYTVAVVDEGLLGLTRFATPDPHAALYAREGLGVTSWDLYDEVADTTGLPLDRLLAIGGDGSGSGSEGEQKPRRFPPVVKQLGPFQLAAGERAVHQITLPPYMGAVRVMVVAADSLAYGSVGQRVTVIQPISLSPTHPPALALNERLQLPLSLFVTPPTLRGVALEALATGQLQVDPTLFQPLLPQFSPAGEASTKIPLTAASIPGEAAVELRATAAGEEAERTLQIGVVDRRRTQHLSQRHTIPPGATITVTPPILAAGETTGLVAEVSILPSTGLESRLEELIRYPHGCIEQLTSAALPQLALAPLTNPETLEQQKIDSHITATINRLASYQLTNGSFSYWPGGEQTDEWSSSYVGLLLVEAQQAGYHVPAALLNGWRRSQSHAASRWSDGPPASRLFQAFRLQSLALSGQPEIAAMNRLRAIRDLPPLATWLLADAYILSGLPKIASDLIDATPSITENPSLSAISYGSLQRNQAIELMVLDRLGHSGRAATMANRLAATLDNGEPLATHTTAWVLHALGHHFRSMAGKKTLWGWQQAGSDLWLSEGQAPLTRFAIDQPAAGGELTFRNFEPLPLHLGLTATGVVNAGEAVPEQNGIGLRVSYLDRDGREISGKTGRQGDEFSIRISVSNPGERKLRHLALTLPIASGWQLQRLLDSTLEHPPQVDHQRILDDRIDLYFDLDAGEERHFAVELVNSFSGRFYRPGARIESMYRLDINAAEADGWIVISPPPGSLPIVHNNLAQRGEI